MSTTIFNTLGEQLLAARKRRGLSQPALATRLGRDRARISELERDLATDRRGRDRLTLFAEICDALDLVPVLLPKSRMGEVRQLIGDAREHQNKGTAASAFEELFVDLDEDDNGEP
ncbi:MULTISPECIES: helix-turn-helix domain-containing protein [Rhizobium]|uniref:Helix-turn-helix domain-containing protein n=5 Tax=Rhizobium TaxID=379 RepID=A0A6P1CDH5_RHITR|nr:MULTISPECIES: helix-turn-helix transcriptional regulator [Rhizobium]AGB73729.1 transcriptional regulator, XRE family [Rhizobium tropici CIAT 899]ENN87145.1 transcriptional regulator, XRE family [Rhizobium freirei PRF 81]MBB4245050.1 transcriptional regulator with XRE-family HTH domain [Rhizobium tropici]MBB4569978.1 transcriptional regulator with XRE-family HTH domain [Rhizobium leucaenae]MBB5576339.1 transcriptional regulator with XRE-family HTH domain [Rhizobium paranaense]